MLLDNTKYMFNMTNVTVFVMPVMCVQQSWVKRLRDKFKKYRSRSKDLTSASDVQKMKLKYGRKRTEASANLNPDDTEPMVKVQRVRVSSIL